MHVDIFILPYLGLTGNKLSPMIFSFDMPWRSIINIACWLVNKIVQAISKWCVTWCSLIWTLFLFFFVTEDYFVHTHTHTQLWRYMCFLFLDKPYIHVWLLIMMPCFLSLLKFYNSASTNLISIDEYTPFVCFCVY